MVYDSWTSIRIGDVAGFGWTEDRAMAQWLRRWVPNPEVPCSKPLDGSKSDSAFHPSEVNKMSNRDFWELNGKK